MWQLIPSLQQCFPTDQGEKHPLNEGNLGGLLISLWFAEGCYCWNNSRLLFTTTSASPPALHYLHCVFSLVSSSSADVMTISTAPWRHVSGSGCFWSPSRVELGSGGARNTLCDCVSSASQLSGQGSLLLAERKQESEWKRQAQSWGCFFSYSQSTSSSSCCNPAIKIVFHSAFSLYITKATTGFFFLPFSHMLTVQLNQKIERGQIIYLLPSLSLPPFPNPPRVFGLLWKTILIIWKCGSSGSCCVLFFLCSFPSQSSLDVGLVVLFSEECETSASYYPGPSPYTLSNLWDQHTPTTKYTWLALSYVSAAGQGWR